MSLKFELCYNIIHKSQDSGESDVRNSPCLFYYHYRCMKQSNSIEQLYQSLEVLTFIFSSKFEFTFHFPALSGMAGKYHERM